MRFLTATRLVFFLLLAAFASTLLVACSNGAGDEGDSTPTLDEANLTVDQVYARFAEAINRPGSLYRVTTRTEQDSELYSGEATSTAWIDVGRNLARDKSDTTGGFEGETTQYASTSIVVNGWLYTHYEQPPESDRYTKVQARTCYVANAAASSALGCPGGTEKATTTLDIGEYEGHHALILVTSGTRHGEDETTTFTERLYLNASTLLPIALEGEGDTDYGEIYHGSWLYTYQNDFVPAGSLPDDFFDPASIGYVEHDPEEQLNSDLGITVDWLGKDFAGSGGLPPLTLASVTVPEPQLYGGKGQYRVMLEYRLASDEFGSRALSLQEYDLDDWNASRIIRPYSGGPEVTVKDLWEEPCWEREDILLPAGHGTIALGFQDDTREKQPTIAAGERACPSSPHDHFVTFAFLGSTVVLIDAPGILSGDNRQESPYDTLQGMEAVVRALQPRQ